LNLNERYHLDLTRGFFFDFDGLILDTETPEVTAWTWMYAKYQLEYPAEFWQHVVGRGPDQLEESSVQRLRRLARLEESEESVFARFRERYFELLKHEPQPGVVSLLEAIHKKNIPMWVVSSSDHAWVSGHVAKLGLGHFFQDLVTRERATRSKPAPDLYLEALRLSGLKACESHAFEDSYNGMVSALDAGLTVTVCPNPTTKHLDFSRATRLVQSLHEELERVAGIEPA
jgi:HAD superfamily hydrolase (TIGR01509 family)